MTVLPYQALAEAAAVSDAKYVYRSQRQTFRTLIMICCINWTYHAFNVYTIVVMNKLVYVAFYMVVEKHQGRRAILSPFYCKFIKVSAD